MKTELGKTLRTIRQGKQVSITELADQHLSKSQISRFERGESEISASRLINLLDKLNMSMDEFLIVHNQEETNSDRFHRLINFIRQKHRVRNIDDLKDLLERYECSDCSPKEVTMIKSIISPFDNSYAPSADELDELVDYLFKVDQWGYYEITLLGNCNHTIPYTTFFLLTKEMLRNYVYSTLHERNKKLVIQLAINCLIYSIDNGEYLNAQFLIQRIEELLENELFLFEKTVFLYTQGYYNYQIGQEDGVEKMSKAIQVFDLLDETQLAIAYREHYQEVINKDLKDKL